MKRLPYKIATIALSTALLVNCATADIIKKNPEYRLEKEMKREGYRKESVNENLEETALIFLGWHTEIYHMKRLYPNFDGQHKIIYQLPNSIISSDLEKAEESIEFIINKINEDIEANNINTVYGISLGTCPAIYAANHSKSVENLILSLPGDEIADVIWKSWITKHIKRRAERKDLTKEDYDRIFDQYDPVNNLDNLQGKEIYIYVAKSDKVIPYENAMNLIEEMRKRNLNIHVKEVENLGHYFGGIDSMLNTDWF